MGLGGYPIWLKFKPPFKVRTADPAFLAWNDHWYDKILPIVAAHQIHKGGNVILVQLENEHPNGWGTVSGSPYFDHLRKGPFAGNRGAVFLQWPEPRARAHARQSRGPHDALVQQRVLARLVRSLWQFGHQAFSRGRARQLEILAGGGAGHNFYMLHGGTNFETWNDDSGAASYDYGAAIGQAGELRPIYYRMKRANLFAQNLPELHDGHLSSVDGNGAERPWPFLPWAIRYTARILGRAHRARPIRLSFMARQAEPPACLPPEEYHRSPSPRMGRRRKSLPRRAPHTDSR